MIGRSNAPHRRTRELRHYLPSSILGGRNGVMLHTLQMPSVSASQRVESAVHLMLRTQRVHGSINPHAHKHSSLLDWFHVSEAEAVAAIRRALEAAGIEFTNGCEPGGWHRKSVNQR